MARVSKRQRILDFVAARGWARVGEAEWSELRAELPDVSESTIRASGIAIDQPWRGVSQHTLDELESSLREMSEVYEASPHLRRACRDEVIAAKARARFAASSNKVEEARRRLKGEMVEWMLVWLGHPAMFPAWAAMRRERINGRGSPAS